jgi:hypothetical protein
MRTRQVCGADRRQLYGTGSIVDRVFDAGGSTFGIRLDLPNPHHVLAAGLHCTLRFRQENVE